MWKKHLWKRDFVNKRKKKKLVRSVRMKGNRKNEIKSEEIKNMLLIKRRKEWDIKSK